MARQLCPVAAFNLGGAATTETRFSYEALSAESTFL